LHATALIGQFDDNSAMIFAAGAACDSADRLFPAFLLRIQVTSFSLP
jgi:hypothetical protein